jgi:WD40 repeat protein
MQRTEVPSEILGILNSALLDKRNRGLKGAEKVLVDGIWLGLKYEEIADRSEHKLQYLKNTVGPALFRDLREAIDPKINKINFRALLEARLGGDRVQKEVDVVAEGLKVANLASSNLALQAIPATDDEVYGREKEMEKLRGWLKPGVGALVCVYSLGGFGKTTLVAKVVREVAGQFDNQVMWISLQDQQSYERVLALMLQRFEEMGGDLVSLTGATALEQCLQMMQVSACLVVLEDFHRVLPRWERLSQQGKDKEAGQENWRAYRGFLEKLNSTTHRSSVVVVSREQPRFFSEESGSARVHSIELEGLDEEAIERFLIERKVTEQVDAEVLKRLRKQSMGHPLTLKLSGARIRNLFDGDIQAFLNTGSLAYGGLKDVLAEEFKVLTSLEKEVLYWLLINRDPVETRTPIKFGMLRADVLMLSLVDAEEKLGDCLDSLMRKSLIDSEKGSYRLHELVGDYVKECLVEDVVAELVGDDRTELYFLNHCALVKAKSNDSIRQRQVREVITPIVQRLQANGLKRPEEQKVFFTRLVERARNLGVLNNSYLVSNIVQLCRSLGVSLAESNFSGLAIRQSNFRGLELHDVSFEGATISQSIFNDIFGGVLCVRCSPNGLLLASSDTDGNISIWDYMSRDLKIKIKAHTSWILQIRFSPDGQFLVSASEDGSFCIWQVNTGECLRRVKVEHKLMALDLSPDGKLIAVAGESNEVFLWDSKSGELIKTLQGHSKGIVWSCTFSPDNRSLVSTGTDRTVRQWDLEDFSGQVLIQESSIQCRSLVYSPDGKYLVRVSDRNIIRIWDIEEGCDVAELKGHSQEVWTVVFGRNNNEMISAGTDKQIFIWDIKEQKKLRVFSGHDATIYSVAYHPREFEVISGSADQSICFWEYFEDDIDKHRLNQLQGFSAGILAISFAKEDNGYRLFSGGSDQLVYCWDLSMDTSTEFNGNLILDGQKTFPRSHSGLVWSIDNNSRTRMLLSAGDDAGIHVWNAASGLLVRIIKGHSWSILSLCLSADGRRIASGSMDETLRIFDTITGAINVIASAHAGGVRHVKFTHNEEGLVSCGNDNTIKIWNLETSQCIKTFAGHQGFVQFFDIHPNSNFLISCSDDRTIRLWGLESNSSEENVEVEILRNAHTNWIRGVCFNPDGKLFASCGEDGLVCLWSTEHRKVIWQVTHEEKIGMKCIAFSPDGYFLASGSHDGTIRFWNVKNILSTPELVVPIIVLRTVQPYRGLNLSDTIIGEEQRLLLRKLGAIDHDLLLTNS